jgi:hypothetical protein
MANPPLLTIAVEGPTDTPVARRIAIEAGFAAGAVYEKGGRSGLDRKLRAYNEAAKYASWFVLRDFDNQADCPPALIQTLLPVRSPRICFRIAVLEVEAWLLGDRTRCAEYFGVALSLIPDRPEAVPDPKQALVNVARRSRQKAIREDMVPEADSTAVVGPGYLPRITDYATNRWRPGVAAEVCQSLAKAIECLKKMAEAAGHPDQHP